MVVDPFVSVLVGFAIGAGGGALSAFLGWNKSGEPFEPRKFISGVVTGIVAGIVLVLGSTSALQEATNETVLLVLYVTIFVGIVGVDNVRTSVTGAITQRQTTTTTTTTG